MTSGYRPELLAPYHKLDQGNSIQAECIYFRPPSPSHAKLCLLDVWIGGHGELRCKSKVRHLLSTLKFPSSETGYLHPDDQWEGH